jgi:general secretion pathway protein D
VITSLRLKGLLASAIVMTFGLPPFPTMATAQSIGSVPAATASGQSPESIAQRALLQARQALAQGELGSAKLFVDQAKQTTADFKQIGDSPEILDSMIQRQEQLLQLANARDPSFNAQAATFLLLQADAMLMYQDFDTAEALIRQADEFKVEFNSSTGSPAQLLEKLQTARAAATSTAATSPKTQVLSLLAKAQLAIDREQWEEAQGLVAQAKAMGVAENQFAANDLRPWQLELKIQTARNRTLRGASQTGLSVPSAAPAVASKGNNRVVQAAFDPAADTSKVIQVAAESEIESSSVANVEKLPVTGLDFYNAGVKALARNDKKAAVDHFQSAWKNRDALDGTVRLAIKTHLEKLAPESEVLKATLASQETDLKLDSIKEDQRKAFSELQSEIFKERTAVDELLKSKPRDALVRMQSLRSKVAQSKLDPENQRPLLAIVDRDIAEMQKYIDQNLPEIVNEEANSEARDTVEREQQRRLDVELQLQQLVNQYNQLVKEKRFAEAGVIVDKAAALAPGSVLVTVMTEKHRAQSTLEDMEAIRMMKADSNLLARRSVEAASVFMDADTSPLALTDNLEDYTERARERQAALNQSRFNSPAEARIYNLLENETVQGEFTGSLSDTMDQLGEQLGVNIIFDDLALEAESVNREKPVNINIRDPIGFKSALEVILSQSGLAYVVENEVIKITSKDALNSQLQNRTYYVGDLIMPMSQNPDPFKLQFMQPGMNPAVNNGSFNVAQNNGVDNLLGLAQQLGQSNPSSPFYRGPNAGTPTYVTMGREKFGGITENDYEPLIDLITNTIGDSEKWSEEGGGPYNIRPYASNLSLVISAPQEIHDEVQSLMKKLRELNDVQIVIEVRFLTLNENFFEKIGIDFDFAINDDTGLTLGQATSDRLPGNRSRVVGRIEPDLGNTSINSYTPTQDLDLRFTQGNFSAAVPQFGGTFVPGTAGNFGFAILSDIEVFFLIQAAKQDNRSVITQAPTVTMFNGQGASIFDGSSRPFVTAVVPIVGDFAVAHQPIITILPDGTNLNVQATVTENRRFVRLNLVPMFSHISEVETFTFDGSTTTRRTSESVLNDLLRRIDPSRPAGDQDFETVTSGVTIQLPVVTTTTISTVVSVPDGGTVLLGGIKRMSEGRSEGGLPLLSNIPYINRLFRNTAIGHTTSNQMMMVTPRIIIQKEIEEDMVGIIN